MGAYGGNGTYAGGAGGTYAGRGGGACADACGPACGGGCDDACGGGYDRYAQLGFVGAGGDYAPATYQYVGRGASSMFFKKHVSPALAIVVCSSLYPLYCFCCFHCCITCCSLVQSHQHSHQRQHPQQHSRLSQLSLAVVENFTSLDGVG